MDVVDFFLMLLLYLFMYYYVVALSGWIYIIDAVTSILTNGVDPQVISGSHDSTIKVSRLSTRFRV